VLHKLEGELVEVRDPLFDSVKMKRWRKNITVPPRK
jgi:hypothetical protein